MRKGLSKGPLHSPGLLALLVGSLLAVGLRNAGAAEESTFSTWMHSGAGIAMPSSMLGLQTQPASLSSNEGFRFGAQSEVEVIAEDPNYRGLALIGMDWFGVAGSIERLRDDEVIARYGASVTFVPIGLSIGAAAVSGVQDSNASDLRAGLLFHPAKHFQLGATAVGLKGSVDEYGLGLAMELLTGAALIFDATSTSEFQETQVKAGLKLGGSHAGVTASIGSDDSLQISKGFSGGAFFRLGRLSTVEVYYRPAPQFGKYLISASLGF